MKRDLHDFSGGKDLDDIYDYGTIENVSYLWSNLPEKNHDVRITQIAKKSNIRRIDVIRIVSELFGKDAIDPYIFQKHFKEPYKRKFSR